MLNLIETPLSRICTFTKLLFPYFFYLLFESAVYRVFYVRYHILRFSPETILYVAMIEQIESLIPSPLTAQKALVLRRKIASKRFYSPRSTVGSTKKNSALRRY